MTPQLQTASSLNTRGMNALVHELGMADAMRFLNQFRAGDGNYTLEREQLLEGTSVKSLVERIKAKR
jgi:hypothetical protein